MGATGAGPSSPYDDLRVIEIADDPAGEMVGRLMAELGAQVVKVEPPSGSPTRRVGPFAGGVDDGEHSLSFWFYNLNKHSVVVDTTTDNGRESLRDLVDGADLVITTRRGAALEELDLHPGEPGRHERLIVVAVTPFGLDGPWTERASSDLVGLALGGPLNCCGYDDHSIPPIRPGGNQGFHTAAVFGHLGVLLALVDRVRTGRGQLVDVSMHESLAVTVELANPYWHYPRVNVQRQTCRHAQPVQTQPTLFEAADGRQLHFVFITTEVKPWQQLVSWMDSKGLAADLVDDAYLDPSHRQEHFHHIQGIVEAFFLMHDSETLYREGQQHGLPIGVLNAPEDLLRDRHLQSRGFFTPIEDVDGGVALHPGLPYRFTSIAQPAPRRAPLLNEHADQGLPARRDLATPA